MQRSAGFDSRLDFWQVVRIMFCIGNVHVFVYLVAEALQLPPSQRTHLLEKLIASLDTDPVVEGAWASEVERRLDAITNDTAVLLPGAETLTKLRAEFQ